MNLKSPKIAVILALFAVATTPVFAAPPSTSTLKPTIVLVHGAFADGSSWNGVIGDLLADGYPVIAAANPLRSVKFDADSVSRIIDTLPGPVILVGHSYGGEVISAAAVGHANVRSLVFVAAFAPERGETALSITGMFSGSTLGGTLATPVRLSGGGADLYIQQDRFPAQFAADVPIADAKLMAAEQRPITKEALAEPSGDPAWKSIPSWFVFGSLDLSISPAAHAFMAARAKSKKTVIIDGASHAVMVSHSREVASLIEEAASR